MGLTVSSEDVPAIEDVEIHRKRRRRVPAPYCDTLPTNLPSLSETPNSGDDYLGHGNGLILHGNDGLPGFQTPPNRFGLFRRYFYRPSYDLDGEVTLEDLAGFFQAPSEAGESSQDELLPTLCGLGTNEAYHPFPNISTFMVSNWFYNTTKQFDGLISVMADERFKPEDTIGFNAKARDKLLDLMSNPVNNMEPSAIGRWECNVPVTIQIPEGKGGQTHDEGGNTFTVPGLHHRSISEIIRSVFEVNIHLHFTPFELWWQPDPDIPPQRIYSDISSSQAFHDAYREVNETPHFHVPGCKLEKTVAAIMVYSDSTHLAQFGTAKLWPIYSFTGNLDKWFRLKPSTHSCEHWAYIPSVSD